MFGLRNAGSDMKTLQVTNMDSEAAAFGVD